MHVLLMEDDVIISNGLLEGLAKNGVKVDLLSSGRLGIHVLEDFDYDAVILDLGLPELDGLDLLKQWREKGHQVPVLILTARDALPDRLAGLNNGADDYLIKPFSLDEVVARLHALVRRTQGRSQNVMDFGNLSLDTNLYQAKLNHQVINLTSQEWQLLLLFVGNPNKVFSRADIEDKLYGWSQEVESNAIEVHIHNLRKKINKNLIVTRRNLGYQLGEAPQ